MTSIGVEITRTARFRVLSALLIGAILLHLAGCVAVPPDQNHSVPDPFSSNRELPSLDVSRLPLHAALVVPDSVQAMVANHVVLPCALYFNTYTLEFPVGELISSASEEMLSQLFISVDLVSEKAAAHGNYDVVVELTSPVVRMENDCSGGQRDLNVRMMFDGKITDRWGQTLLGEASFEKNKLPLVSGYFDTSNAETIRSAMEHALLETMAGLVRRLATKPKLLEYVRAFEATPKASSSAVPITPAPVITAPTIY